MEPSVIVPISSLHCALQGFTPRELVISGFGTCASNVNNHRVILSFVRLAKAIWFKCQLHSKNSLFLTFFFYVISP